MTDATYPRVRIDPDGSLGRLLVAVETAGQPLLLVPPEWSDEKIWDYLQRASEGTDGIMIAPIRLQVTRRHL